MPMHLLVEFIHTYLFAYLDRIYRNSVNITLANYSNLNAIKNKKWYFVFVLLLFLNVLYFHQFRMGGKRA